jgi:acetolactate synthase-1/2/3 large subunit
MIDQGVDTVFGYPVAVLPIYDEIFQQNSIKHVLVRHNEQGAVTLPRLLRDRQANPVLRW